ncbi:hypothetical protein PAXRUDRAFT_832190 [Paxillus rubicundulus Ve08.2h10]|uniref:Uncharacterized protein n=1 Tax=Paxillus rubicundulus Ve08.2h10 TaxID=930991 RepID=A0A0D0DRT1_9AGAM|nr:hypothetical protein PAXRUDRAFT_832190 [Paxillus rubicundulus Ve08.2h10]
MDLSPQRRPDISKINPPPQMWMRCVESGPNESKIDPISQKRTPISVLPEMAHQCSNSMTQPRNSSPALEMVYPNLPAHFQLHLCISKCPPSRF